MAVASGTLLVVLAVLAVVLLVVTPDVRATDANGTFNDLERSALLTARQDVLKLTTLTAKNADAQVKSLRNDATGSFRDQLVKIAATLKQVVVQQKVSTVGKISESAVTSSDPKAKTVTVLIAATQQVKNASAPLGDPRNYRFKVTMQQVGTRLLVADMGFVT